MQNNSECYSDLTPKTVTIIDRNVFSLAFAIQNCKFLKGIGDSEEVYCSLQAVQCVHREY